MGAWIDCLLWLADSSRRSETTSRSHLELTYYDEQLATFAKQREHMWTVLANGGR